MTPSPLPTLAIENRKSNLDGITLLEYLPLNRIKGLLKSDFLALNWDKHCYHTKWCSKSGYDNEVQQITAYKGLYDNKQGGVPVKYKKAKHSWGRVFPNKSLGFTSMGSKTRNTLLKDLYYDFDLSNAQPKIIQGVLFSQNPPIDCPMIDEYCNRRDAILEELMTAYSVDRKKAKTLMLRLCFFGTFRGWANENNMGDIKPIAFLKRFESELRSIAEITKKVNPKLYETARQIKEAKKEGNQIGSFYALYLQEYE
jgi:hypothetical protein